MTDHEQQQQQSLAELCSICYTDKPKYRCPRCKTQTCSLPCYKRHQQRASCNGRRDPAAFVKRSAWATPAGIDHDYNYLKSVERKVEVASQDVKERGISNRHPGKHGMGQKHVTKAWLPGSALQRYLAENAIHVEKAPTGMSRQRANRTRTTNKGKIMWTVEWLQSDGSRRIDDESFCESSIGELWEVVEAKKSNAEQGKKRKRLVKVNGQGPSKVAVVKTDDASKRPLQTSSQESGTAVGIKDEQLEEAVQISVKEDDATTNKPVGNQNQDKSAPSPVKPEDMSERNAEDKSAHIKIEDTSDQEDEQLSAEPIEEEVAGKQDLEPPKPVKVELAANSNTPTQDVEDQSRSPQHHFYLLKPLTASNRRILIPIDAAATLTACLKGRTVLEYPTIYVLPEGPEVLLDGFQLEENYSEGIKAEQQEVDALLERSAGGTVQPPETKEKPLDANIILDMLQRDLDR